MRTGVLARRTFTLDDQRAFAALSGDWNPLHVDPVAARRTIVDGVAVHGVHLLVWAIGRAFEGPVALARIKAQWNKPLLVDREVELVGEAGKLVATSGGQRVLEASLEVSRDHRPVLELPVRAWRDGGAPVELSRDEAAVARGDLELAMDPALAAALLPEAVACLGTGVLAELLAATRVVGMCCPGLCSLFGGLNLVAGGHGEPRFAYEVAKANLKYSMIDLAVKGPTLAGTLATFYRPPPQPGPTMAEVRARVTGGEFAHQRAIVVGGSRGIGEAIARVLAAGGAEVLVTYRQGEADAARVAAELGPRAAIARLDVTSFEKPPWPFAGAPTHLYYLATPRIPALARFSPGELDEMLRVYVYGLHDVAMAYAGQAPLHVWAPSTIFLDTGAGSAAYAIAKSAMEELGRRLPSMARVTVRTPRLTRIATDQTAGLIQLAAAPALDVALDEVRAMPR